MDTFRRQFGERVARRRDELGLTQYDLSRLARGAGAPWLYQSRIADIEGGRRKMLLLWDAIVLARVLRVTVGYLAGDSDGPL